MNITEQQYLLDREKVLIKKKKKNSELINTQALNLSSGKSIFQTVLQTGNRE